MSWQLDNVHKLNKEAPYTFYRPSEEVIEKLQVGDIVKLIFVSDQPSDDGFNGERMWVEITDRNGNNFTGTLDNEPFRLPLKAGEVITFGAENICDTEYEDPHAEDINEYFDMLVTVSNDVLDRNEFNFMLRDHPHGENDSGWSILSGYEEDDFLSSAENLQVISIGVILNIDDSILEFLQKPPLCAYERNEEGEFHEIADYDWAYYLNE